MRQKQELSRMQEEQQKHFDEQMKEQLEKNHKAVRGLSDSVEDFLDSMQEEGMCIFRWEEAGSESFAPYAICWQYGF